jgi:hypothetical protein
VTERDERDGEGVGGVWFVVAPDEGAAAGIAGTGS